MRKRNVLPLEGSEMMERKLPAWVIELCDSAVIGFYDEDTCYAESPNMRFICTRRFGHRGAHVAHGAHAVAVWED